MSFDSGASYEFFRKALKSKDKFAVLAAMFGERIASQAVRELARLQTYYPGQRTELDYTKYTIWLYPNEKWNEPLLFYTGFGVDHFSRVMKGFTTTMAPSGRDAVRLYRNCVLPSSLWLPEKVRKYSHDWDVFGLEDMVAIDNAMDFVSNAAILMFVFFGAVLLRLPPGRGDLKGTSERTHSIAESQFISTLPGYVPRISEPHSVKYNKIRDFAKKKANMTVAEYIEKLTQYVVEFNGQPHPDLRKPKIQVWRDGVANYPIILPTGMQQLKAVFALTYEVRLTREGVQVNNLKYNSEELHLAYRVYSGKVIVKLDPDDITNVLVILPKYELPIAAQLTTFRLPWPVSLEVFMFVRERLLAKNGGDLNNIDMEYAFLSELDELQSGYTPTPNKSVRTAAQAATHASNLPPVVSDIASNPEASDDLLDFLRQTRI